MDKSFSLFSESTNDGNSNNNDDDSIVRSLLNYIDANNITKFKSIIIYY